MDLLPLKALFVLVCGVLCGAVSFAEWLPIFAVRNAPIVTGSIVARQPIPRFGGIPGVETFTGTRVCDVTLTGTYMVEPNGAGRGRSPAS